MAQTLKTGDNLSDSVHKAGTKAQSVTGLTRSIVKGKTVAVPTLATHSPSVVEDIIILSEAKHSGTQEWVVGQ